MSVPSLLRIADFGPYTQPNQSSGNLGGLTLQQFEGQMQTQIQTLKSDDFANTIRFYSIDDGQNTMIDYAIQQGFAVIPSVYLPSPQLPGGATATWTQIMADQAIMTELKNFVTTLESLPQQDFASIPFVNIGNEEISQVGGWSDTDVESAIEYVKSQLPTSISSVLKFTTAETYLGQYINLQGDTGYNTADVSKYIATNMGLSPDINVIFVNIHPYWDGVSVTKAATEVAQIYQELQSLYPGKEVVISETGWPSAGASNGAAVPSVANENTFWANFLAIATQNHIQFGAFEAFDEPNKSTDPSNVENHWGLLNSNGTFKTSIQTLLGDGTIPAITAVVDQPSTGSLSAGNVVTLSLTFNEAVTVTGGPMLALNDGGQATYVTGSGTNALIFSDMVASTDTNVASLAAAAINLNGGSIEDASGNNANLSLAGIVQAGPQIDTDANFVQQLYNTVLFRASDPGGQSSWTNELEQGAITRSQVVTDFVNSNEAQTSVLPIIQIYDAFLFRTPDPGGLYLWVNALRLGTSVTTIADDFAVSAEFQSIHPAGQTATQFVTSLYNNVLARAPDPSGLQTWVGYLNQHNDSLTAKANVALAFAQSAEFASDSTQPIDNWLVSTGTAGSYPSTPIAYPSMQVQAVQVQGIAAASHDGSVLSM